EEGVIFSTVADSSAENRPTVPVAESGRPSCRRRRWAWPARERGRAGRRVWSQESLLGRAYGGAHVGGGGAAEAGAAGHRLLDGQHAIDRPVDARLDRAHFGQ